MKVIHSASELEPAGRKVCLAIGVFDGLHLGHRQIIRQTVTDARQHDALALVVTFDRHPNAIVAPDHLPPQIFARSQKLRATEALKKVRTQNDDQKTGVEIVLYHCFHRMVHPFWRSVDQRKGE